MVNRAWNVPKLFQFFGDELVNFISKIDILQNLEEDSMEHKFKLSGKSISALSLAARYTEIMQEEVDHWFFKLKLNPRVELFVWRLCMNTIPTTDFLFYRRLADSNLCQRSCLEVENMDHYTATCLKLLHVIRLLNSWVFLLPVFSSFSDCIRKLKLISVRNPFLPKMYITFLFHSRK
ncbi:hypothetical protein MA16_Dca025447 [Dendrobium catenatum]|uniref:Reverse transcriptase zinc-binding domain-containing protein n=1 Tax=Dendrobium catenatum TaxID=906689 RepID=A0A2I0VKK7_9ASPA|nr:hypothetical protein MA16_Dca025447 [Dendrobium catenatum]